MGRVGLPRGLSALLVVIGGIAFIGALLTFAGQQVATGATDLADSTVRGLGEIRDWLRDGPLNASDSQINDYLQSAQEMIRERSRDGEVVTQVTEFGTALGHVLAGFFITLFATYFFLADGGRIWAWIGADRSACGPRAGRQLGARRLALSGAVRACHGAGRAGRRGRHHDRRRDPATCRSCWRSACWSSSARSCR